MSARRCASRASFVACAMLAVIATSCKKSSEPRCARCGMVIAPKSNWETDLVTDDGTVTRFDTPRCGLRALKEAPPHARLRVHEFYTGQEEVAESVVFVVGSDVVGPMGPELVPVDASRAKKFIADHAGKRALPLDQVTPDVLSGSP